MNHTLRLAKRRYCEKKLEDAKSNTDATWKILNEVLSRKKPRPQLNTIFKSAGREISDPVEIANRFCSYTSLVLVRTLQRRYSLLLFHTKIFYLDHFENQSFLAQKQRMELLPLLNLLLPGKRLDTTMAHIMNLSIAHGVVRRTQNQN